MTLSNPLNRADFAGSGTAGPFPFDFPVLDSSHLVVIKTDSNGVESNPTYTVTGIGSSTGGSVTLTDVLPVGASLVIKRVVPLTQATSIRNRGVFFPEIHEDEFDKLVMADQQQQEQIDRAVKLPENMEPVDLPIPVSGSVLGWVSGAWAWVSGASVSLATNLLTAAGGMGTSLINYLAPFTGAVGRLLILRLADSRSIKDFNVDSTGASDSTAGINAALLTGAGNILLPAGTYTAKDITPQSNQTWQGAGRGATILQFPQVNSVTPTFNLIKSTGDIINLTIRDMTLQGAVAYQTTPDGTAQNLAALHLRAGSVQNLLVENCHIKNFGDQTKAAGAGALIGPTSGSGKTIDRITFRNCTFENNANVPGVYIQASPTYCTTFGDVTFDNCTFISGQYADQNMIYALTSGDATPTLYGRSLNVVNCRFIAPYTVDTGVEVNAFNSTNIDNCYFEASGTADMVPVLFRGKCVNASVANNTIRNLGSGCTTTGAINFVPFGTERSCTTAEVKGNKITDYAFHGMTLNSVDNLSVSENIVIGSAQRLSVGFDINGCNDFSLVNNQVKKANIFVTMATGQGGNNRGKINHNQLEDVGVTGNSVIAVNGVSQTGTYIEVAYNNLMDKVAGTVAFYSPSFAAITGNTIRDNNIPAALLLVNSSYSAFVKIIGQVGTGSWAQGALSTIAAGTGFTIPGGGTTVTGAAFGDIVDVSYPGDLLGCTVTGYVSAANTVSVRVQNGTAGTPTLGAATWTVQVRRF